MGSECIIIRSSEWEATIHTKGAELQRLYHIPESTDVLWNGDPNYWGKFSPVLFPIIGTLKDDSYTYKGKKYSLPRHGFARDFIFETLQIEADRIEFRLKDNEKTRKNYPFAFELKITYQIKGNAFVVSYEVHNSSEDEEMWYSLGAHPAFRVPLKSGLVYDDYHLLLPNDDLLEYRLLENGLVYPEKYTLELDSHKLPLRKDMFYRDAWILDPLRSSEIILGTELDDLGIKISWAGFSTLGLWAAKDADFLCIEPWQGVADSISHIGQIIAKEGIVNLAPGQQKLYSWKVGLNR
jgi:galactose mutarotase-like enzyme